MTDLMESQVKSNVDIIKEIRDFMDKERDSCQLADAYKIARVRQERYRATSDEYKALHVFQEKLKKKIKELRPKKEK